MKTVTMAPTPSAPAPALSLDSLLAQAVSRHQSGDMTGAAALYRLALMHQPHHPDALHLLGVAMGAQGELDGAARQIGRAIAVDPQMVNAHFNLGNQLMRAERYEEAVTAYRRLLALQPDHQSGATMLRAAFHKAMETVWRNCPLEDEDDIVIYQHNPGLGDNLLYSTLPEMFAKRGKRVWISDQNRARNPEIHDLVWGHNPYISGVSSGPGKAGMAQMLGGFETHSHILNWLTRIEVLHGLPATHDLPRIYYRPTPHPILSGRVLVDLSSTTIRYPPDAMQWFLRFTCERFHYDWRQLVQLRFSAKNVSEDNAGLDDIPSHTIGSIYELCDALAGAQAFITVHSGANSLAAAIKGDNPTPAIHCAVDAAHYNQKCYIWRNVDYTIVESQPKE